MTQKKKLFDFLSAVPSIIVQQASSALTQVKQKALIQTKTADYATPAFANSEKQIFEPAQPNYEVKPELDQRNDSDTLKQQPEGINAHLPLSTSNNASGNNNEVRNINIQSVLTERSEIQQPARQSAITNKKNKLSLIEEERMKIQQELKNIEVEIEHLKEEPVHGHARSGSGSQPTNTLKKYKVISDDPKAFDHAQKLVSKLHVEKRLQQEKRQKQQRDKLEQLERDAKQKQQERQQELQRIKNERREQIARRINQQQRKRQQRKLIQQQSNQLIKQIKKEEASKMKPVSTSLEVRELENKKRILEKKRNFDLAQIEQHQLRYKEMKIKHNIHRSEEPHVSMSMPKYPKGKFLEQIEIEERHRREGERIKEEEKRTNVEKRLKYGELVKKIFLPPKPTKRLEQQTTSKIKPPTPQVVVNGSFKQELSRKTYTNSHDDGQRTLRRSRLPELAKATGSSIGTHPGQKDPVSEAEREQRQRIDKLRIEREKQIRRQTKSRLKHAQEVEQERKRVELPKVKKYENYLEQMPKHKQSSNMEWKAIIDNDSMSKEQKYKQLMSKANFMENKAKFKEQMASGGVENDEAMNLIIGSIQAKLALLDKF